MDEEMLPIVLAGLKSLSKDLRINELVAAATEEAGFPNIKTVGGLIAELVTEERAMPRLNSRIPIMAGGGIGAKGRLLVAAIILLYVLATYGLANAGLLSLRGFITAHGGVVFVPMLMRFAAQLFTERRLFVAEPLEYNAIGQVVRYPAHVVRLEFEPDDGILKYKTEQSIHGNYTNYSTIIGPINDTYGELPALPGSILFSVLNSLFERSTRSLPKLVDGEIQIPLVEFPNMGVLKDLFNMRYNYLEEELYFGDAAIRYAEQNPPEPQGHLIRRRWHNWALARAGIIPGAAAIAPLNPADPEIPYCDVKAGSEDPITLNNINENDVLINYNYGNEYNSRLYNCATKVGTTMTYTSYSAQTDAQKRQWLNSPINMDSRSLFKAHIVQAGGRRCKTRRRRTLKHSK